MGNITFTKFLYVSSNKTASFSDKIKQTLTFNPVLTALSQFYEIRSISGPEN